MQLEELSNISDSLAMMPDPALQKFAQMHKQDPYMVSLALSESNRRKKMRMAAQGQAGAMPQPKVVDAAIQGMAPPPAPMAPPMMAQTQLPENQGIAQLPTPNMQRMADGGIAGYEDDEEGMATGGMGGMFNFAQQSEPVVRMSGGGVARYNGATGSVTGVAPELLSKYQQEATEMAMGTRMQFSPDVKAVVGKIQAAQEGSYLKEEQKQMLEGSPLRNKTQTSAATVAPTAPTASAAYDPTENLKKLAQTNARYTTPSAPKNAEEAAMLNRYPATKPAADKVPPAPAATSTGGVRDLLPAPPKLDTSFKPAAAPTADDAIAQGEKIFNSKARIGEVNRQVLQEQMDADKAKENSIEALRAFNEKQGPAYAGYEKLLQKEELQDATDKEKAGLMSLMKGFLAMAAGESPNAATNIAKGAMAGLGDYGDALKEFKKAAKERNKEMQNIQQARRAEERGDFKEERMYIDKAETARQASARFGLAAINDITNTSGKVNADILQNMRTITSSENIAGAQEAGRNTRFIAEQTSLNARALLGENRADARAQMLTGDARTAMMLGTGNTQAERLKSGMAVLQELSTDKSGAKTVETLAKINADRAKNGEAPISMADLVASAREYSALMYPKVGNDAPTRER
jgi:hypothetical protein